MQLGSSRQSVPSECLQPRRWPETFQEWISQPRLVRTLALRSFGARLRRLSHPSVLQAASSSKAAVSALAPYPLVNAPSHSESLWLITDLSRTNTPTLFTTPRKNVMSYTSGACSQRNLRRLNFGPKNRRIKSLRRYLAKVDDIGGFKKYAQAHLARVTTTFKSKLSLPARPARLVAEYWLHAGFYLSPPPPPAKCDRKGGGRKKAGKKKK